MRNPHNEHPQSFRQKMGWGRRAPECLAFPRETEQKPAHWRTRESCSTATSTPTSHWSGECEAYGASWLWPTAEGMTASRKTTCSPPHWTTNLALPDSSGYARSFLRRALSRAAPSSAHCACGVPSRRRGETSVVSKTTCAPWNSGNPSATTSRRRASTRSMGNKSKSLTITFVMTLAPASRHTRAAAFSKANPRRPKTLPLRNPPGCCQGQQGDGHTGRNARKEGEGARGGEEAALGRRRNRNETTERWGIK